MSAEIGGQKPKAPDLRGRHRSKPLYPIVEEPKAKKDGKPAAIDKLVPGDAVASASARRSAVRRFASVVRSIRSCDTIILAHGGNTLGYALHWDGCVVFAVRTGKIRSRKFSRSRSKDPRRLWRNLPRTADDADRRRANGRDSEPRTDSTSPRKHSRRATTVSPWTNYSGKPFVGKIVDLKVTVP
jgi:hypothetical protein